eukprot:COSAG01_NODE_20098_length_970_cov_1.885189_1_plen_98_part_00
MPSYCTHSDLIIDRGAQVNLSPVGGGGAGSSGSSMAGAPGGRRRRQPQPEQQQDQIASVSGGAEAVAQAVEYIQAVREECARGGWLSVLTMGTHHHI